MPRKKKKIIEETQVNNEQSHVEQGPVEQSPVEQPDKAYKRPVRIRKL